VKTINGGEERPRLGADAQAARKRAAVETYSRHEAALRRTARRYSICADDAEDALQRGLEILLRKAPTEDPRELIRWTQTVVKHEALAVRRERERILAGPAARTPEPDDEDWVAQIPSPADGPPERAVRHEAVARSREALQALKPQELRALTLLGEGYSYAEIGELTGYSRTKINRCLAEGRERYRELISSSEDGRRCAEMRPLISAFCDGEAEPRQAASLREHLRACPRCRATLRAYRAAPGAVAALAPALPLHRSLLERAHDALAGIAARFGGGGEEGIAQVAGGGGGGAGMAALAKVAAICVGTAGGAAACVSGVVPVPLELGGHSRPALERRHVEAPVEPQAAAVDYEPAPESVASPPSEPEHHETPTVAPASESETAPAAASGAVEYAPPPASTSTAPAAEPQASSGGDPGGEFGP
jgi:RNA polymerase sigma factor (sigma-70 family)